MGQKVNPHGLRVGVIKNWDSRWFAKDEVFGDTLVSDYKLRKYLKEKLQGAGVPKIEIERDANRVKVFIHCAKPGVVIGRGGTEIEKLRLSLEKMIGKSVALNIVEVKAPDMNAQLVAENIAQQLEKRISHRRAMKNSMARAMRAGAVATGAGLTIKTFAGYLPLIPVKETASVVEALKDANESTGNKYNVDIPEEVRHSTGSTDYGDVANIMPTIQFGTGGYKGVLHNPDVMPTDEYLAYVMTAKVFALAGYKLLKNGGEYAKAMLDSYEAVMTRDEYIKYMDSMMGEEHIDMQPLPLLDEQK